MDEDSTTEELYQDIVQDVVIGALNGVNGAVFTYGQTGTGKQFTLRGEDHGEGNVDLGLIQMASETIHDYILSQSENEFVIKLSCFEIYNEALRDLSIEDNKNEIKIRDVAMNGEFLEKTFNPKEFSIKAKINEFYNKAIRNSLPKYTLAGYSTARRCNIFLIFIESYTEKDEYTIKSSYLSFAKLAGSERASKTSVTGERLKEATKIGLSISSIGNVISALSDTKIKKRHIPYRDSRMTYLLADCLGGNCNTVFVGTINPSSLNINESLSTIRYMNRVSNISSISHQNINDSRSLLIQIDKIYKCITNLSNCGEILDIFEGDNKDVINEVTQCPKLTVKLLLDYLKFANNKPKHILFKGLLEPSRCSCMFPVDEFIAMLESLNKSFIKIELFSNRELLNQITKVDINFEDLDFLHYQLKRIDSKFLDKFDQNYEKASDCDK